jgi:hypothetical protein
MESKDPSDSSLAQSLINRNLPPVRFILPMDLDGGFPGFRFAFGRENDTMNPEAQPLGELEFKLRCVSVRALD